ncbi:probable ATP-dependent Clp protease ATP-binding subunit [Rhodococcus jostii RHA1]|uniref:Probable ATP-dependent Clp protease ATP-binding subunit n=1 Tax=Rhodococcus jostii (strain RHA1) TaxID=101510 RepID=Q0SD16_RHOJR|nr:Clp protease N-terminal domain-containing protein [Rhodococcus jostii]ABG94570.1 probable ATP-dependent Clp protease ATP-binding subunit [Rhodococcus jostii RHA1]
MFDKFSDQARHVVVLASDAARTHHHNHLGTEHLLTGIHAAGGPTAATLTNWGITSPHLDSALDEIPAYPNTDTECAGPPFTPTLTKTLVQSLREASLLGHHTIRTEHLLLALLADTTCTGTRILTHLTALSPHQMRDHLRHQLTEHPQPHE